MQRFFIFCLLLLAGSSILYGQSRVSDDVRPIFIAGPEAFGRGSVIQGDLDLNNNGKGEFFVWELDHGRGYVYEATGDTTFEVLCELTESGRFIDLDNDGKLEYVVVIGTPPTDPTQGAISIFAWDYTNLKLSDTPLGTTNTIPYFGGASPWKIHDDLLSRIRLITNLDNDPQWEIFAERGWLPGPSAIFNVVELDVSNMASPKLTLQFTKTVQGENHGNGPAVMDLDGDGFKELMLNSNTRRQSYVIRANSNSTFDDLFTFTWPLVVPGVRGRFHNQPVIYDVDGDGKDDVYTGEYYGNFFYLENKGTVAATLEPTNIRYLFRIFSDRFADMLTTGALGDVDGNGKVNFYYVSRDDTALIDIEYQGGSKADSASYAVKYYRIPKRGGYGRLMESYWDVCLGFKDVDMASMDLDGDGKREVVISSWAEGIVGTAQAGFIVFESAKKATNVERREEIPQHYKLSQNYPNPFNPTTEISYELAQSGHVRLEVYSILGQRVATLVDAYQTRGTYRVQFHGTNLAAGVYLYQIIVNGFMERKKMVLAK